MKKLINVMMILIVSCPVLAVMDGQGDNQTDVYGYYYAITGGKFVNGQTVNGAKTTGGSMAYLLDDPSWGSYTIDTWNKDGWFTQTAGLALTMKSGNSTVYDNFNNNAGDFYTCPPGGQASGATPGLYRGYCMSNNFDWIYAGYFKLTEAITITQITGYFDENAGFDADNPLIGYRMNIWSNLDVDKGTYIQKTPSIASFSGDVMSSDNTAGTFSWGDTGVDRIFGDDYGNAHDDILFLTYTLDTPITLQAGEYWFSHDATVPEPATMAILALGGLLLGRKK
ncbi:MAG: PEP-CTERM sorting domain-containing protein [Sedimentisphaerales bacterium]